MYSIHVVKPKVTVIIPAYNAEMTIEQCAKSVLNQTLDGIEVIFIDDGSKDKTGTLLDSFVKGFGFARVIHQNNHGLYRTREIGLTMASGEYVGWVDADDFIEPNMYEKLYTEAISLGSDLVFCDYDWFPYKTTSKFKWFRKYKGEINTEYVERNSQVWNKIVKRELLVKLDIGSNFVTCLDEVYIKVLMEAKKPVSLQETLYHYRVGSGTMSTSYSNINHYKQFVEASKALSVLMNGMGEYWDKYFEYRIIYYMLMCMVSAVLGNNMEVYYEMKNKLVKEYPSWKNNMHIDSILNKNFGVLTAFAIKNIIPLNYNIAKLICRLAI